MQENQEVDPNTKARISDHLENAVRLELQNAMEKFKDFQSAHEGYAVALEELEELEYEFQQVKEDMAFLWRSVKKDDRVNSELAVRSMIRNSRKLLREAVQLVAMAKRFEINVIDK